MRLVCARCYMFNPQFVHLAEQSVPAQELLTSSDSPLNVSSLDTDELKPQVEVTKVPFTRGREP